jgi:hypothetical protein
MNEEPKKWKRGDIGPDGRLFWRYHKQIPGGVNWITREKFLEYMEKDKEHQKIQYLKNPQKIKRRVGRYRVKNLPLVRDCKRRSYMNKTLKKADGSSYETWLLSLVNPTHTINAIFRLQPDPGQTLAEFIHELSGYPMEVCEQIANPPAPVEEYTQPEKLDNPTPADTLPVGPDLF